LTIGFDLSDKSENILISYTKWILKWFAIVCVVFGVGIGGWLGYMEYQDQIVPMVAIECEDEKGFDATAKSGGIKTKRHYLVQKRRKGSSPHALYRPSYYNKQINLDTSPDDYRMQSSFDGTTSWEGRSAYTFDPISYSSKIDSGHWIVRDNLQVIFWVKDEKSKKWKSEIMGKCRQITFDEFYAESKRGLNEVKSKLKF
jgi:hypothetical protein